MILDRNAFGIRQKLLLKAFRVTFKRGSQDFVENLLKEGFVEGKVAVYIHFPFCKGLCPACPYVRYLWNDSAVKAYLRSLKLEISVYGDILRDLELKITEVHIGGGTPSCLEPRHYKDILESLKESFDLERDVDIGIEANPEDLSEEKLVIC
ncbi:MAG TPA: hypothetical protein EYP68_02585 [Candidatus Korarchaeota archaeon]|nr:hypothetical protein [Candidatus Korarchaeota archaeon]